MVSAYPLSWPAGWKRAAEHKHGQFKSGRQWIGVGAAVERIVEQLRLMGVDRDDVVISTNLKTRMDGLPRADQAEPKDSGAAVYWRPGTDLPMRCMAIDVYWTVADNLAALAATLEAMRAIERHGGAVVMERAFLGFKALPAETEGPSWWSVLQLEADATESDVRAAYTRLARVAHPDAATGSHEAMSALNAARDQGLSVARNRTTGGNTK